MPRDLLDHREPGRAWRAFMRNLTKLRVVYADDEGLAARCGRNTRWLRRLSFGATAPHIDDIEMLARIFGVDPGDLAFGAVEKPCAAQAQTEECARAARAAFMDADQWAADEPVDGGGLPLLAHAARVRQLARERNDLRVVADEMRQVLCVLPEQIKRGQWRRAARSVQRLIALSEALAHSPEERVGARELFNAGSTHQNG